MSKCEYGCRINHQHETTCQGEPCPGCLPRPAEVGQLCAWCHRQLTAHITEAPKLIIHLDEMGKPFAQSPTMEREGGTRQDPAEGDPYPAPWHDRDDIENMLTTWAKDICQARFGHESPELRRSHHNEPPLTPLSEWMLNHLDWFTEHDQIIDMRAEFAHKISTSKARFPTLDRSKRMDIPCPRCDLLTLVRTPPSFVGQPLIVSCDNPDCARVWDEESWDRITEAGGSIDRRKRG